MFPKGKLELIVYLGMIEFGIKFFFGCLYVLELAIIDNEVEIEIVFLVVCNCSVLKGVVKFLKCDIIVVVGIVELEIVVGISVTSKMF